MPGAPSLWIPILFQSRIFAVHKIPDTGVPTGVEIRRSVLHFLLGFSITAVLIMIPAGKKLAATIMVPLLAEDVFPVSRSVAQFAD